jgi:hypothetical protein
MYTTIPHFNLPFQILTLSCILGHRCCRNSLAHGEFIAGLQSHILEKTGRTFGNNDLWIASHALAIELILVTNNDKEFSRVSKLAVENWVK